MRLKLNTLSNPAGTCTHTSNRYQISAEIAVFLRSELKRQPEVRPEVVARARALASNPDYPSFDILRRVADQILRSPDLSEEMS